MAAEPASVLHLERLPEFKRREATALSPHLGGQPGRSAQ